MKPTDNVNMKRTQEYVFIAFNNYYLKFTIAFNNYYLKFTMRLKATDKSIQNLMSMWLIIN